MPIGTTVKQLELIDGLRHDEGVAAAFRDAMTAWKLETAKQDKTITIFDVIDHIVDKETLEALKTEYSMRKEKEERLKDSEAMYAQLLKVSRGLKNG